MNYIQSCIHWYARVAFRNVVDLFLTLVLFSHIFTRLAKCCFRPCFDLRKIYHYCAVRSSKLVLVILYFKKIKMVSVPFQTLRFSIFYPSNTGAVGSILNLGDPTLHPVPTSLLPYSRLSRKPIFSNSCHKDKL